ncbi:hypothetical protein [Luteolibacter marinus]|uniref:hypothetical protein n=1 Tax=Luteolibacter marinus TaxID=2776705 RepID=UPI001867D158|nr:hypothetical protein [Luteolibacter marinus]
MRVLWDPDDAALVLVDFGDPMWAPVAIDGEQVVQTAGFVRGSGVKNFPRGNESHQLTFELARITDGVADALKQRLLGMASLPRTMKPVLIVFDDGVQWRLSNCAVQSWPGGQEEFIGREGVVILGGALAADVGVYVPGATWGEINFTWEDLG